MCPTSTMTTIFQPALMAFNMSATMIHTVRDDAVVGTQMFLRVLPVIVMPACTTQMVARMCTAPVIEGIVGQLYTTDFGGRAASL